MNAAHDGGPAFPVTLLEGQTLGDGTANGMTLRDYFAAKAMQSFIMETGRLLQHCEGVAFTGLVIEGNEGGTPTMISEDSYAMADAMLTARK